MPFHIVKNHLQTWFDYPEKKVYCQVSTSSSGNPRIRTMELYHLTEEGSLVFITETNTRKWQDLRSCHNVAICIVCLDHGQIVIEGSALLKTSCDDIEETRFYWNNFLDSYWRDFYLSLSGVKSDSTIEIPPSFGVIVVKPHFWELLEINQDDFLKSSRKQFHLQGDSWIESKVSSV